MKNIVLYIISITTVLLSAVPVNAQKPTIELLPVEHQFQHREALVDTIYPGEYMNWQDSIADSSDNQHNSHPLYEKGDQPRERTGWRVKAFQFKREAARNEKGSKAENRMRFFRSIHPVQLFFKITALK
jgi:hypothetical protein